MGVRLSYFPEVAALLLFLFFIAISQARRGDWPSGACAVRGDSRQGLRGRPSGGTCRERKRGWRRACVEVRGGFVEELLGAGRRGPFNPALLLSPPCEHARFPGSCAPVSASLHCHHLSDSASSHRSSAPRSAGYRIPKVAPPWPLHLLISPPDTAFPPALTVTALTTVVLIATLDRHAAPPRPWSAHRPGHSLRGLSDPEFLIGSRATPSHVRSIAIEIAADRFLGDSLIRR